MEEENERSETEGQRMSVERINCHQMNLLKTTKDYMDEIRRTQKALDPNIPIKDAIEAEGQSMKDITTVNMFVKTIKEIKSEIRGLKNYTEKLNKTTRNSGKKLMKTRKKEKNLSKTNSWECQ